MQEPQTTQDLRFDLLNRELTRLTDRLESFERISFILILSAIVMPVFVKVVF